MVHPIAECVRRGAPRSPPRARGGRPDGSRAARPVAVV